MEIPKGGLIGKGYRLLRRVQVMGIPGHAATAGYFIVLSVFPSLKRVNIHLCLSLLTITNQQR